MKSRWMLVIGAASAALLFASDAPREKPRELEELRNRVAALEEQVKQLEARINSQNAGTVIFQPAPLFGQQPDPVEPPNIGHFEVNGLKVYKVPLGEAGK